MPLPSRRPRLLASLLSGLTGATALTALSALPALPATAAPVATGSATPAAGPVWTPVDDRPLRSFDGRQRRVAPASYAGYQLDLPALRARLGRAPSEGDGGSVPATISVPSPSGELVEFALAESPVMEAGLAAAHPEIRTYAGRTTSDDDLASIRLDVTPMGFHASVRAAGSATWYVDPAYDGVGQGADALYLSYRGDDLPEREQPLVEAHVDTSGAERTADRPVARIGEGGGALAVQRTYRLALVSDPSYATYFTSSTDPAVVNDVVTAEKVTLMNRVNQIYGDDLSVRMLLVDGNDALNFNTAEQFLGADGRCGNLSCYRASDVGCGGSAINTNRLVVGQIIGADRYDIGHIVFGPDGNGGGVAYFGAVGGVVKAGGCTGLAPPTGDGFAIDYVAHEMGHQFAGSHTFSGVSDSCAGNRDPNAAVEPGSGVSVMAYAGICGIDNLQNHSDPYFSQRTQQEVAAFTRSSRGDLQEVQNVALSGFDSTGDSFTISYGGATTATVTLGDTYTAAGLETALEAAEPSTATATVVGSRGTEFGTGVDGFQVTWSGTADVPAPTVTPASGTFTTLVGTYDNGGPQGNGGHDNPTPTGNHNPTVTAPAARTIPVRTPFALTGSATDVDGDALTYLWEQNDVASTGTVLSSNTKPAGALFRTFGTYAAVDAAGAAQYGSPGGNRAGTTPTRSFPDAAQVAAGATNAATGTCPALTGAGQAETAALNCFSEFLPTTARTLHLRLTARDLGGANGGADGGTSYGDTALTVGTAGPFLATSQPTATSVTGGTSGTVTWNVAGTGTATYATDVRISFSTDGGLTFPTVLSASTPNDGTEAVTWPNESTTQGRVRIEAVDNYFYDLTDGDVTVVPDTTAPDTTITAGPADGAFALARTVRFRFASEPGATYRCSFGGPSTPCGSGDTVTDPTAGSYELRVTATDGAGNVDPTPATRRYTVPVAAAALRAAAGPWKLARYANAYRGEVRTVAAKGATLTYRVNGATSLALVLTKAPRSGSVDVFLGSTKLRTIRFSAGTPKRQQVVAIAGFRSPRSGLVRIRTTNAKRVRVEGLGVRTD